MIWAKTEAGRAEMQARSLVKERVRRNLLLLIDGTRDEATLRQSVNGAGDADFAALVSLGLIAPAAGGGARSGGRAGSVASGVGASGMSASSPGASDGDGTGVATTTAPPVGPGAPGSSGLLRKASAAPDPAPLDYAGFTAVLTGLVSKELGLRGFLLTLAIEKAGTIEELRAVADRVLAQIDERRGAAVAESARRALFGG